MEARVCVAGGHQPLAHPLDHAVVLGVDHGDGAVGLGDGEDVEELAVLDLHQRVGDEDLEGGHAAGEGGGQLLGQDLLGRVGDDQVVAVVDHRVRRGAAVIEVQRLRHPHAAVLGGEGDEGGVAPEGRRDRARVIVVRGHDPRGAFLGDVAVGLDAAGQHQFSGRVDDVGGGQILPHRHDAPVAHAHVGVEHVGGGGDRPPLDDEIQGHAANLPPAAGTRASAREIRRSSSARSVAVSFGPGARTLADLMAPRRRSVSLRSARPRPGWTS